MFLLNLYSFNFAGEEKSNKDWTETFPLTYEKLRSLPIRSRKWLKFV